MRGPSVESRRPYRGYSLLRSTLAGTRVARSECGVVLSLAFAPDAVVGSYVIAHAGIAVRVLDPDSAEDAEALREAMAG